MKPEDQNYCKSLYSDWSLQLSIQPKGNALKQMALEAGERAVVVQVKTLGGKISIAARRRHVSWLHFGKALSHQRIVQSD